MFLRNVDSRDSRTPTRPPPPLFILPLVVKAPRHENHLIIRTHGGVMIPDDLDHTQPADGLAVSTVGGLLLEGRVRHVREAGAGLGAGTPEGEEVDVAFESPWWRHGGDGIQVLGHGYVQNGGEDIDKSLDIFLQEQITINVKDKGTRPMAILKSKIPPSLTSVHSEARHLRRGTSNDWDGPR